ncbi:MAG: hypothetical protein A3G00_00135 [Candidatus Magasanikbacteria bacterium RIFCSPLOWO2_12_FULL_43_12]|uniref:Uncharacterized protein n=1 Tax=Candidatus Magasanikbacteria bacterium RIFCSPLOWO2_12_FULL_43_12 TaxID=1798692 RepID=A0A1F6MRH5_9BACT|nr:MAG: hypothetical protein A3I93_00520 [Candidatus Magasanikbacteria bacterium RIFCSPLOWO2_02_FULL_43_22]OGH74269.1 MAG: hypothetical protein A3G00_00135 [Candidatus Magasanikbacteria bacterium RIFCSPLOWO2_12_FULL_43_12]
MNGQTEEAPQSGKKERRKSFPRDYAPDEIWSDGRPEECAECAYTRECPGHGPTAILHRCYIEDLE